MTTFRPGNVPTTDYEFKKKHYGVLHRKLAKARLAMFPFCEICDPTGEKMILSVHAHHRFYPATNIEDYRALCFDCNEKNKG